MKRFSSLGVWALFGLLVLVSGRTHATGQTEAVTYYYADPQGSVLATADVSGNTTGNSNYRPYGAQAQGAPAQGPGYTGHVNDVDTSLVYMQARYYDPSLGRFLSADPASMGPGSISRFNRYSYVANNPVSNVDPDGRNAVTAFGGLLYETGQWLSGQGFDSSHLAGALVDGYNGEGAGVAMSAVQDVTSFVPAGALAKGVQLLRVGAAEGKVAQLVANRAAGKAAEQLAKRELAAEGNQVLGSQVSANTSAGRRVIDHLIRTPEGKLMAVEVKAGNGVRSASQVAKDNLMATEGATLVGRNAPGFLRDETVIMDTIERRYPIQ
jgi:RHS repeat-associated protein